ncbi:MAG: sigma 54-interacting transcriptional regulator [Labilithrix sp.]|nr:sigma 54-interacting transcriptional regulator [Labilithrix sp.]
MASSKSPPAARAAAHPLAQAREAFDAGDFARVRALAQESVRHEGTRARTGRDDAARAEARRLLALSLLYDDKGDDAARLAEEAVRIARAAGSRRETALGELALAEIHRAKGDAHAGLKHAARARQIAERSGDTRTGAAVLSDYALLLSRVGDDERAREAFDMLLALPLGALPRTRAMRVLYNAAMAHRAAGRFDLALRILDRAGELPASRAHGSDWTLTSARLLTLVDMGAFDDARALLDRVDEGALEAAWQRAQLLAFRAGLSLATGGRPEAVEAIVEEGLALEGVEPPLRFTLERIRALSLLQRGRFNDAERVAIGLTAGAAKGGTRAHAAQALAIAARAGAPDAWLLRWLGALACASGGSSARIEHEAYAALVTEPEPIGQLARSALVMLRARLVDRAPPEYRKLVLRTLRQVEQRTAALRQTKRAEAELVVGDEVLEAKDAVGIAGESPLLMKAIATVARAARSNASLVLTGETGSGKELFARFAHRLSPRARAPFVAINCAAIPQPLLEAELFGHERGAFTGAERARRGLFVEAEGGTLFLDEVGEMSPAMQAKLLRVLEDGEVRAIGGNTSRKVDVRVVGATHRDLSAMVAEGAFREDLYYRLAAITVRAPALRERPEDLPALARALLAREPATKDHRLDVPALTVLSEHAWPGNVRELANVLRVAGAMVEGTVIGRPELAAAIGSSLSSRAGNGKPALKETTLAALRARHRAELRELVGRAIASADGNKLKAARALGVSRQGLYRVLGS